jgi:hypothetical protein
VSFGRFRCRFGFNQKANSAPSACLTGEHIDAA